MEKVTAEIELKERVYLTGVFNEKGLGKILNLTRLTNGEYDRVYKVDLDNNPPVILKIFRNKNEPNRDAFLIVDKLLIERKIHTANVLFIGDPSEEIPTGFMVMKFIEGIDSQDAIKEGKIEYSEYYAKLGSLMRQVHTITFPTFGLIGEKEYPTYIEYMKTRLLISFGWCKNLNIFTKEDEQSISNYILGELETYSRLPGVLTHGDISPDNCRLDMDSNPVLIDWADGMSSQIWLYDFSVMTYWMHWIHESNPGDSEKYRLIFLNEYGKKDISDEIRKVENAIQIFHAIGLFAYYKEDTKFPEKYEHNVNRFKELLGIANLTLPASFI